ncbi:unnamed protein product [Mytilus coruscus]|uniref:Flavin-containing monooxygenase n=1 Tax=Mytilus coruscus TaxID=42192 RepID=A0A6J8B1B3_MYTCO|nr:unnamed protein product [Mytilus coruscus]
MFSQAIKNFHLKESRDILEYGNQVHICKQFPSLVANSTLSTTTDLESSEKKVAVIGAGVSGISALRNLTWPIGNIKPVAFERSPTFGGHWSFTNDTLPDQFGYPSSLAIYSGLRTNLPKELMTFPGFEHDSTLPTFPTQDDIFYYLRRYIDHCDLEKYMKDHLAPKPLQASERFRFDKRDQKEGESIQDYVAQLRKLSLHCGFNADLKEKLRDRIVCGLKNPNIQKRILSEKDLTYDKAVDIGVAMETASKDATELQAKHRTEGVNKMSARKSKFQPLHNKGNSRCYRCNNAGHSPFDCKFKNTICHNCNKTGHMRKACMSKSKKPQPRKFDNKKSVHAIEEDSDSDNCIASLETYEMNNIKSSKDVMWVTPTVEGVTLKMELDTGSAVSVISQADFSKRLGHVKLIEATITLQTYSGESIKPLGCANVKVHYKGEAHVLPLYVVPKGGPPLFGREWLKHIKLDWNEIKEVHGIDQKKTGEVIKDLLNKYKDVFKDELGTIKGIKAKLSLKDNSSPKYIKARTVSFSLRAKVEAELDRLEKEGTLNKVQHSELATPIVPVLKKNGNVRICGDFKVTLNPMLNVDQYSLPNIDDIFANLNGGIQYTKMDLKQAYLQLEVDEDCKDLLTINTHRGLYRYNRMAFGIASAPAIWQRTIEQILSGIPGTQCLLDDMIITGSTDEEHLNNLESVLKRLNQYGLKANIDTCEFFKDSVTFCGHVIDKHGLHKTPDKIKAIKNAPAPENVSQLKSILGLINYYAKFLPDLSATLSPLHNRLRKDTTWKWIKECQEAFDKV